MGSRWTPAHVVSARKAACLVGTSVLLFASLAAPARAEELAGQRSVAFGGLAGQDLFPWSQGFSEFAGAFADVGMSVSRKLELGFDLPPLMLIRQPEIHLADSVPQTMSAAALDVNRVRAALERVVARTVVRESVSTLRLGDPGLGSLISRRRSETPSGRGRRRLRRRDHVRSPGSGCRGRLPRGKGVPPCTSSS